MMPSPYSSRSSIDDSLELTRLGMKAIRHPSAFEVIRNELTCLPTAETSSAVENLQSRLREISDDDLECRGRICFPRAANRNWRWVVHALWRYQR